MTTKQYKKLNKQDKQHLAECYDGSPSKVTLARIKACIEYQSANNDVCHSCNVIARKLGVYI